MKTRTRALSILSAFCMLCSLLAAQGFEQPGQLDRTPVLPLLSGTYYYEGYDIPNNRSVFVSAAGVYHYVDNTGNITVGGTTSILTESPYRVVTNGTQATFQFFNNNRNFYTLSSTTLADGSVAPVVDFSVRTGTWFASDVTFTHSFSTGADNAAIFVAGASGPYNPATLLSATNPVFDPTPINDAYAQGIFNSNTIFLSGGAKYGSNPASGRILYDQPVVFVGTNVSAIVNVTNASDQQALAIRDGAAVFLSGGTLSKVGSGTDTISMRSGQVGPSNGLGASTYFYGENLVISSSGATLSTFNMGIGNNTVELVNSTITSTINTSNWTSVFTLSSPVGAPGSNHFSGTNLLINITGTGNNRAIYMGMSEGHTFSLVSSTLNINMAGQVISGSAAPIWIGAVGSSAGNHFYGDNLTINNAYGRLFVLDFGANSITLKNSTILSTGTGKGAAFALAESEAVEARADGYTSIITLENTSVTTTSDHAPVYQQVGRLGRMVVTGGTLTTTGNNAAIIRLVGANDAVDESKFTGIFTNVLLDARRSSAIDLDINANDGTNFGWAGAGGKEVTTLITSDWDFVFQSSTLNGTYAMRIASGAAHNSPYSTWVSVTAFDSEINGLIEMNPGGDVSPKRETSGANLTLQGFRSKFTGGFSITAFPQARKIHQAKLNLTDSSFTGDITATGRGNVIAYFISSTFTGDFNLSGATRTYLDFIDSPIVGAIRLAGTARLENSPGLDVNNRRALLLNSPVTGGIFLAGSSSLDLTFSGLGALVTGGITASDNATGVLRFENQSSVHGNVTVSGNSSVTIVLSDANQISGGLIIRDRARLALATFNGTPIRLNRDIALAGIWGVTGPTTLTGLLDITHPLGTISIENASADILTLRSGLAGNGRLDIASIEGASIGTPEIRVIYDTTRTFTDETENPLILSHPVDYGLAAYILENRPDGAYLVGGLAKGAFGTGGAAVFNSQALAVEDWFAGFNPLNDRLEQLRQANLNALAAGDNRANGDTGAFWLKLRADTTRVDRSAASLDFSSRALTIAAGVDSRWDYADSFLTTGLYVETTGINRDFIGSADGRSIGGGGGVYVSYQRHGGLFLTGIARFAAYETSLNTNAPNNALKASYHTQAAGAALEAGWRFQIKNGWWIEPAWQFSLGFIPGVSYTTESTKPENRIDITFGGTRAIQNAFRVSFGRHIGKNWDFNARALAANVSTSGGKFSAPGMRDTSFTIDGFRFEAAAGLSHPVGRNGRFSIDATTIFASDYTRPVGLTLGYTHRW